MVKEILSEMATVCKKNQGYGFILQIFSDDHDPAHVHMLDYNNQPITRILLTDKPKTINDIYIYDNDPNISNNLKRKVLNWAQNNNNLGINNWLFSISIWNTFHDE